MFRLKSLVLVLLALLLARPVFAEGTTSLITLGTSKDLGSYLAGKDGMTLYSYALDTLNTSNCYDKCSTAWPPLTVDSADQVTAANGIPGKFSTSTRKDGKLQVTYNGMPLYYWFKDAKAGDTTGHRVGRVWWIVPPATVSIQKNSTLGSVLVGPTGMTVYTYTKDTKDVSNCYDKCAQNWPPLTLDKATDLVPGVNLPGKFNTITRKDGTLQVTYNGMPLYYWKDDKALGDASGEGVGKVWFTVVPETVNVGTNKDQSTFLITPDGMTLYAYADDTAGVSKCTGDCTQSWIPYTVGANDRLAVATGLTGKLATLTRDDKSLQVTYNGTPLYLFKNDKAPGDAKGLSDTEWSLIKP